MNTCTIYNWPQDYCKNVVDQTVSYYCKDHQDTEICKFENRNNKPSAQKPSAPTTVIPKTAAIIPPAITDPTDSPTTSGFPIFPLIGGAIGIIFLVAVGISLFLFCRKQKNPSTGQQGPSKMEEGASKTKSIESKSVAASPEKTGGDSKIKGNSKIGGKSKIGKSKIGGKPEKSKMTPRNDGRSAFMYTG
ncbi:hypothetical protein B9Z55_003171 [Caenorhabditis nigoni]|uniref:Uncharacterized protein n=1 Tax=Caenorhabditis nigoni TaxID=1611254 RepID=A0A2G5VNY0_9PELO|nr:hypothetical protein B9Z55_003171 [Caenorhabditis nigoni]